MASGVTIFIDTVFVVGNDRERRPLRARLVQACCSSCLTL